ncbi:hypothetical protein E2C01_000745 [Portunus trituberculatus]|uniref:Uncharacterized protein n=1 Tax=Portunus trituberculatus TaxID=210409 RepID=A0A5B7CFZ2_PORTR|nr:hypothetical protein [Portunus trituberculatus]
MVTELHSRYYSQSRPACTNTDNSSRVTVHEDEHVAANPPVRRDACRMPCNVTVHAAVVS